MIGGVFFTATGAFVLLFVALSFIDEIYSIAFIFVMFLIFLYDLIFRKISNIYRHRLGLSKRISYIVVPMQLIVWISFSSFISYSKGQENIDFVSFMFLLIFFISLLLFTIFALSNYWAKD